MKINKYIFALMIFMLLVSMNIAPIIAFFVALFSDYESSFQTLESISTFAGVILTLVFSPITIYYLYKAFDQQKVANKQFAVDSLNQRINSNLEAYYQVVSNKLTNFTFCHMDFDLNDLHVLWNDETAIQQVQVKNTIVNNDEFYNKHKPALEKNYKGTEAIDAMFKRIYCGPHWHNDQTLMTNEKFTDFYLILNTLALALNMAERNEMESNAYYKLLLNLYKYKIHPAVSNGNCHLESIEECSMCGTIHGIPLAIRDLFYQIEIAIEYLVPVENTDPFDNK